MRRWVIAGILIGAACADCPASRKFTGSQYLAYDSSFCEVPPCPPNVSGLMSFGVSAWVKRNPSTGEQVIVGNQTPGGYGFTLLLHASNAPGDPDRVVFRYRYPGGLGYASAIGNQNQPVSAGIGRAGSSVRVGAGNQGNTQEISVAADVSLVEFSGSTGLWFHVAADLDLAAGTARIFLNGQQIGHTTNAPMPPAQGGAILFVGGGPGAIGFGGDVHDVCVIEGLWTAEPPMMGGCLDPSLCISASDAVTHTGTATLRFNARLRQSLQDSVNGMAPQLVPANATLIQGMGPRITYADQPPTVFVIGDTQFLDYADHSQNPDTSVEMKNLGIFVRDYRDALRISAVFHVGDWVDHGGAAEQEVHRARALANKLNEACIPWACTIGNHDYTGSGIPIPPYQQYWSSLTSYTMPAVLFKNPPCPENPFVAQMTDWPPGSPDLHADEAYAHAFNFEIDGHPQLGITVPYLPSISILQWAKDIANAPENASKPVWLSTHSFLNQSGIQTPEGRFWWDNYLQFIPNLQFIICGHYIAPGAYLAHHRCDGIYDLKPVHQLLVNGQQAPGGGKGFLQILSMGLDEAGEFSSIDVESYIPLEDRFLAPDATHEFTLALAPCGQDCNNNGFADRYDIHSGASADLNFNDVPDECEGGVSSATPFDLDHDGVVGVTDLLVVLTSWGPGHGKPADFDGNDLVGLGDVMALLAAWGLR